MDWGLYRQEVESMMADLGRDVNSSLKQLNERLCTAMRAAATKHVGKVKRKPNFKAFLNPAIKEAIKERNTLRRTLSTETVNQWKESCK